jgi:5-methyltetrahydrofolate--homocysteine methyltransferase
MNQLTTPSSGVDATARSPLVVTDNPVPTPPFWGVKRLEQVPLRAVLPYINRNTLYK